MITHRILEDYSEDNFRLFAIHSNVEDYAMAYGINNALKLRLKRAHSDFDLDKYITFPCFEWKDELQDITWHLLCNSSTTRERSNPGELFPDEPTVNLHYLIPEYKDADYVLRTEGGTEQLTEEVLKGVLAIPHVITAYEIETTILKSKENLIF